MLVGVLYQVQAALNLGQLELRHPVLSGECCSHSVPEGWEEMGSLSVPPECILNLHVYAVHVYMAKHIEIEPFWVSKCQNFHEDDQVCILRQPRRE